MVAKNKAAVSEVAEQPAKCRSLPANILVAQHISELRFPHFVASLRDRYLDSRMVVLL